ncbi:MAG TPA: 50S ribosomal protein L21 [Dehalococcoidales bacterium]|nr:50S ribosomal protein L21 [Dehalococcoidales bacterium]
MEGTNIYAIVEITGKQYRVTPGQIIDVDCNNAAEGEVIEFDKVLAVGNDNGETTLGKPYIEGAKVTATSKGTERGDKVIVYKFKAKVRFRKKVGHRQQYTRLSIDKIEAPGLEGKTPAKHGGRHKKVEVASGT